MLHFRESLCYFQLFFLSFLFLSMFQLHVSPDRFFYSLANTNEVLLKMVCYISKNLLNIQYGKFVVKHTQCAAALFTNFAFMDIQVNGKSEEEEEEEKSSAKLKPSNRKRNGTVFRKEWENRENERM